MEQTVSQAKPAGSDASAVAQGRARYWEVDAARGVAIILMVIYHLVYDLDFFGGYPIESVSGFWFYFADTVATMFVFLAGLAVTLSYSRARAASGAEARLFPRFLRRGLIIFAWGMLITLVTYFLFSGQAIYFGILHLIGLAIPLAYPFLRFRLLNLALGAVLVVVGYYLVYNVRVDVPWFYWLGLQPYGFYSSDYRPLLPWFGVMLLGVFAGNTLYTRGVRRFGIPDLSHLSPVKALSFMGRHSLLIYFVHQPVIIGVLSALGIIDLGLFG
ncbi:MAG TPA: heparan-alpha-glucosaminide N-acetyltransferase [Chloroflexia bacterium]|nr:heparan-alpha-glucosaminide N-acetyltransferase [Chloroflexia bacterium]